MNKNHIKKIRVKVKEKPLQFLITLGCFAFLALLICTGMLAQHARDSRLSREQKTVLLEETGALRSDMESEIQVLTEQLAQKKELVTETETLLQELSKEYEASLDTHSMEQITATTEYLEKIRENIQNSEILIQTIQSSLDNNQENTVSILESQMKELTDQFHTIEANYSHSSEELMTLIEYLSKQDKDNTKDVLEQLKLVAEDLREGNDTQLEEAAKLIQSDMLKNATELSEQMTSQYDSLNWTVDNQFNSLHTNISEQYDSLDENIGNKYDSLDENIGNKYDSLHNSISEQYSSLSSDFSQKQDLIQTNMDTQFQNMTANNNQYFQQLLTDMGNGNQSLQTYMEQQFGKMQGKFDQVFQSVSSGKSVLASALLTKGVEIPQDASFAQIKDGILAIPQTICIGTETQYLPGTISYEYHHHTDVNGNQTGEEQYNDSQGGCFTSPVYHVHTDSCYETYTYIAYRYEPIEWDWVSPHTHGNSYTGVPDECRSCSYCGACEIYGGHSDHARKVEYTATGQRLICTKIPESTIDKYTFGCGLGEGQIVGAHIVYQ